MTHRQRVLADRLFALPLEFAFNGLARALGATMRRDHTMSPGNVRRVAVAKLVGMGSIVQATPLIRQLRLRYPNARVTLVTLAANRNLVPALPGVDDAVFLDDGGVVRMAITTARAVVTLIRMRVDLYFDLELYSAFASLLALWAVARNRIGFYRRSTQYKYGTYTHLVFFNTRMPVRQLYLQLGRVVGAPHLTDESVGPLRVDPAARAAVAAHVPAGPYIVVNPNASPLLLERRWPAGYVVAAVEQLTALGHRIVFIGSRSEQAYVASLRDRLSPAARALVTDTTGLLPLPQTLAVLDGAAVVLTNDTGPLHLSVGLGRPTVCLFGPVHPQHYGHLAANVVTLYAPVFCSPCVHEIDEPPCNGNNVCMQRLTPDMVVTAVRDLLDPARPRHAVRLPVVSDDMQGQPLGLVVRASMATRQLVRDD